MQALPQDVLYDCICYLPFKNYSSLLRLNHFFYQLLIPYHHHDGIINSSTEEHFFVYEDCEYIPVQLYRLFYFVHHKYALGEYMYPNPKFIETQFRYILQHSASLVRLNFAHFLKPFEEYFESHFEYSIQNYYSEKEKILYASILERIAEYFILNNVTISYFPDASHKYLSKIQPIIRDKLKILLPRQKNIQYILENDFHLNLFTERYAFFYKFSNNEHLIKKCMVSAWLFSDYVSMLPTSLKKDKKLMMELLYWDGSAFEHIDSCLKLNRQVVKRAISSFGYNMKFVDEHFQNDDELVFEAIRENPYALFFANDRFKRDKQLALQLVKRAGLSLQCFSTELRSDPEICLEAIKQKPQSYEFVAAELKSDPSFVETMLQVRPDVFEKLDKAKRITSRNEKRTPQTPEYDQEQLNLFM